MASAEVMLHFFHFLAGTRTLCFGNWEQATEKQAHQVGTMKKECLRTKQNFLPKSLEDYLELS